MALITRRQFLKGSAASLLASVGAGMYIGGPDLHRIEITSVPVVMRGLASIFHGYRIVQISDIHMGTAVTPDILADIASLVNQQKPDLIAITGDFIHRRHDRIDNLSASLKQLDAPDGVVGVLGNHDHWAGASKVRQMLNKTSLIELPNDVYTVERSGEVLNIAGVDDLWVRNSRLNLVMKRLPSMGPAVLLVHEPDFADVAAATGRFGLQMSGHSHGGQIVIPMLGPPILPSWARKYPIGRYQVGDMVQYTNRGLGTSGLQVRVNCRPEITVFKLLAIA